MVIDSLVVYFLFINIFIEVDSNGVIRIWQLLRDLTCIPNSQIAEFNLFGFVVEQRRLDKIHRDSNPVYTCAKALAHGELSGVIIGCICYSQYGGERLVVYGRDSCLYLFNGFTYFFYVSFFI